MAVEFVVRFRCDRCAKAIETVEFGPMPKPEQMPVALALRISETPAGWSGDGSGGVCCPTHKGIVRPATVVPVPR